MWMGPLHTVPGREDLLGTAGRWPHSHALGSAQKAVGHEQSKYPAAGLKSELFSPSSVWGPARLKGSNITSRGNRQKAGYWVVFGAWETTLVCLVTRISLKGFQAELDFLFFGHCLFKEMASIRTELWACFKMFALKNCSLPFCLQSKRLQVWPKVHTRTESSLHI